MKLEVLFYWLRNIHDEEVYHVIRSILQGDIDDEWLAEKASEILSNYPDIEFPNLIPILRQFIQDWLDSRIKEARNENNKN